jgi:hypothetical protein
VWAKGKEFRPASQVTVQKNDSTTPRFVVLRHEPGERPQRPLHWDFMIEVDAVLRTWALAGEPAVDLLIAAEALADHRLAYLEFQGPISAGRGSVTQWDRGTYRMLSESADHLTVELAGHRLCGVANLTRQLTVSDQWTFRFSAGRPATSV